ncbi:hypothetical protein [Guptibacillus hwajinpoensis]|uniref:hypothetical protein n=1 Tax=Guptibacillus hwajinpoensis TaxID=208199 RepID=UPI003D6C2DA0
MEIEAGEYIAPNKNLFSDFVQEWYKRYAIKELSPTVVRNYMSSLRSHILPVCLALKELEILKQFKSYGF